MDRRQLVIPLLFSLVVAGLSVGITATWPRAGGSPAAAQETAAMAVDAVPGGGVDSSRTVTGTDAFDVEVRITAASASYAGWQAKVRYDSAVLAWVPVGRTAVTYLYDTDNILHAIASDLLVAGTLREVFFGSPTAPTSPAGSLASVRFRCVADGTSSLHLAGSAESPASFSTTLDVGANAIPTDLFDAQVTCQGVGAPAPTATPGAVPTTVSTPGGPVATPTPLPPPPPGMEAVPLVGGVCQFEAWTGADGTSAQELAGKVRPPENLEALWAQQPPPVWRGYSPQFAEVSDMGPVAKLDVIAICMKDGGDFVRPIV
jgi:hypothetical protein